MLLLHYKDQK